MGKLAVAVDVEPLFDRAGRRRRRALGGPQQFLDDRNAGIPQAPRHGRGDAQRRAGPQLPGRPTAPSMSIPTRRAASGKKAPDGKLIDSDEALIDYFLDSAKVAAVHGGAFGLSPAFRVSYATSEAVLKEACVRIQQACARARLKAPVDPRIGILYRSVL